mgnify:FL=1
MATGRSTKGTQKRPATTGSGRARTGGRAPEPAPVLDADTRHEIVGIVLAATAIALLIALVTESSGVLPQAVSHAMRLGFGIGAYAIPVLVMLWAVTFFVRSVRIDETRVGLGLGIVLIAAIALLSIGNHEASQWESATLAATGGYIGGGVAWLLRKLLGQPISYVVAVALALTGLVVAGLSIAEVLERVRDLLGGRRQQVAEQPAAVSRRRAAKTVPLAPFDTDVDFTADASAATPRGRRSRDPEAARATLPTAPAGPPRSLEGFELPPVGALTRTPETAAQHKASEKELRHTADLIEQTLATFDVQSRVVSWVAGPTVTMYELEIAKGVKLNRVTALSDDLALALAAPTIRFLAPIPGKTLVGIEVPNVGRATVTLGDVLHSGIIADPRPLLLAIGKDVAGEQIIADLAPMPHLLIAGSTGTGKSVCINALIMSLLMRATPAEVRLILIDPKRIELNLYNGVPHLYVPVVTEAKEAASALHWAVGEMESRLKKLGAAGARNLAQYNTIVRSGKAPAGAEELPFLVIIIDELADLMMVAAKEVEDSIVRLAQLARAAGIHLIVATQRPSTDIITGLIKTNITHRIAFAVSSGIDSRVILDQPGAEKLVGQGDMLFSTPAWPKPRRIQGAFVTEEEINAVVAHVQGQAEPDYHEEILHLKVTSATGSLEGPDDDDPLVWEAADMVVVSGMGSTSLLQRRLKVGYARAGRIMDMLEAKGIVGPPDGSRPREVLVDIEELEAMKIQEREEYDDD